MPLRKSYNCSKNFGGKIVEAQWQQFLRCGNQRRNDSLKNEIGLKKLNVGLPHLTNCCHHTSTILAPKFLLRLYDFLSGLNFIKLFFFVATIPEK